MVFLNKEVLMDEANRLNVDLEGLTWPQMQKAVAEAKSREEELAGHVKTLDPKDAVGLLNVDTTESELIDLKNKVDKLTEMLASINADTDGDSASLPSTNQITTGQFTTIDLINQLGEDPAEIMRQKKVLIAPGIAPTKYQYLKYDEELGEDLTMDEAELTIGQDGMLQQSGSTNANATYMNIKGTGRKTIAQSTLPKENARIEYDFTRDMLPRVISHTGEEGYLWTHHRLPNVKGLLEEAKVYEEYKDRFKKAPVRRYITGLICVDCDVTDAVLREIEKEAQANAAK